MNGQAALAVLVGAALIGLAPIGVRLSDLPPVATNLWRFVFALPILALWAANDKRGAARDVRLLLIAGVFFALELSLWAASLTKTTVANATLLTNMTPIFAAVFGWLLLKERIAPGVLLGGAVALTGAVLLAIGRAPAAVAPTSADEGWIGDLMATGSAFGYAAYLLMLRAIGARVGVGGVMFWAGLSGVVVTFALALLLREPLLPHSLQGWLILIGLGVVVQVGGQGLIAYGVGRLPILISTVLLWMQPLAAAVLSWLIFGEALGPLALFGAALILAGLFVAQRARAGQPAKTQ
ncbi:MAG TPA: DMT family transporter [Vitreimonas sp.]|uniref:DMT family transporter n=1 Tax=Vitreimonas sp. TaxID=3069702 RepID=UPI002D6F3FD4|nr:DMT family transporter [Vitreimonas sp.]HYD87030.1 DMT family transporter [Vitreimonas sp.]